MRSAEQRALYGGLALLLLENPRVSAAKMGARPSGSTTTNSVTKALNANSIRGNFTHSEEPLSGMTRHSPRKERARPMVLSPIRPFSTS